MYYIVHIRDYQKRHMLLRSCTVLHQINALFEFEIDTSELTTSQGSYRPL